MDSLPENLLWVECPEHCLNLMSCQLEEKSQISSSRRNTSYTDRVFQVATVNEIRNAVISVELFCGICYVGEFSLNQHYGRSVLFLKPFNEISGTNHVLFRI